MVIHTTFNIVNIRKMWEKKGKIRRTRSMTKKRSSEIFTLKMEIFLEIGPRRIFLVPPNSAPGLRPCSLYIPYIHMLIVLKLCVLVHNIELYLPSFNVETDRLAGLR